MTYKIKFVDGKRRRTILTANKFVNNKDKKIITLYFDDEIICQITEEKQSK